MTQRSDLEVWMQGPIEGVPPLLQPVAHALLQACKEVEVYLDNFNAGLLWEKPAASACVAFHLQHMCGVIDRMFTYARNMPLNEKQFQALAEEGKRDENITPAQLIQAFRQQVDQAIEQLKETRQTQLTQIRYIGRKRIPTTLIGLLFHAAEHTQRHLGQLLVTVRVLKQK